jgi:prepilin-type N-terminal cleavage/methylation domain-containing protein
MSKDQGFTIAEVMIAIAVIGIAFLALAQAQISNMRVSGDSKHAVAAREAVTRKLQSFQERGYRDLKTTCLAGSCDGNAVDGIFTLTWSIDTAAQAEGWVVANIRADWDKDGPARSFALAQSITCVDEPPGSSQDLFPECPL